MKATEKNLDQNNALLEQQIRLAKANANRAEKSSALDIERWDRENGDMQYVFEKEGGAATLLDQVIDLFNNANNSAKNVEVKRGKHKFQIQHLLPR